uniref:G-protein coupled receptors family 1 profile domain-containing protein n=1 Tax=Plectus sambesii TaxID=2011161 RepID=A0A914WAH5_9BILA
MSSPAVRNRTDGLLELVGTPGETETWIQTSIIYLIEGALVTIASLPLFIVVALNASLREQKEYVIFAALSLANGLFGIGYILGGGIRLPILLNGDGHVLTSGWSCYTRYYNLIYVYAAPLVASMNLIVSVDRLLAIFIPFRYFAFTNRYAFRLVGFAYAYHIIPAVVGGCISYQYYQEPKQPAYCTLYMGTSTAFIDYYNYHRVGFSIVTILLYIPMMIQIKSVTNGARGLSDMEKLRRIKSVTVTVFITAIFTVLSIIPTLTSILNVKVNGTTTYFYYILPQINGLVNSVIYTMRYKDLRTATFNLFLCRLKKATGPIASSVHPIPSFGPTAIR